MSRKQDEALRRFAHGASLSDAQLLLKQLRWRADQRIINHFDEDVWLKPCYDSGGKRIGITECCFADNPCPRHRKALAASMSGDLPPAKAED